MARLLTWSPGWTLSQVRRLLLRPLLRAGRRVLLTLKPKEPLETAQLPWPALPRQLPRLRWLQLPLQPRQPLHKQHRHLPVPAAPLPCLEPLRPSLQRRLWCPVSVSTQQLPRQRWPKPQLQLHQQLRQLRVPALHRPLWKRLSHPSSLLVRMAATRYSLAGKCAAWLGRSITVSCVLSGEPCAARCHLAMRAGPAATDPGLHASSAVQVPSQDGLPVRHSVAWPAAVAPAS